ncbi:MAG: hypothetical protein GX654_16545 [Desulfatiglans sp.]|jgi:hypothetical protein|nr:hypothetical protein [Desulfatiglans sp.]
MNLSRAVCASLALISLLCIASCGYRFRAEGEPVGIELTSIAIPMIESTSSERGFEADFTEVLRNEFISRGRVSIKGMDNAQMVLKVQVYDVMTRPLAYDSTRAEISGHKIIHETTGRRRLTLSLNASLVNRSTGETVWSDPFITEEAGYDITSDPLINRKSERDALLKIARLVSGRIFNLTMERF